MISIIVNNIGLSTLVKIIGNMDMSTMEEIKQKIFPLVDIKNKNIKLDLSDVDYIDSIAIGFLMMINKLLIEKGKRLIITKVNDKVLTILKMSSLDLYFGV